MLAKRDVPPKNLPKHLSPDEYFFLCVQYFMIGSVRTALKAALKAMAGHSAYGSQFVSLYCVRSGTPVNTVKLNRIQYFLVWLALSALDAFLVFVVPPAKFLWKVTGTVSTMWQNAAALLRSKQNRKNESSNTSDSDELDVLPRAVARVALPDGLSADEYLKLGKQYKQNGWITLSQDSLARAQELAPDTATATDARRYLLTKVPKPRVTLEVEQRNLEGYHFMAKRDLPKARDVFESLMQDYPDFEWSYLNLATAYYRDGQLEKAKFLLRKLLSINPDHAEAWDILARVYGAEFDIPEAQNAVTKALELYPEDNSIKTLIECLAALN